MSLENAKANLEEFGKELNLEGLAFDENYTCILGIDNTFSLHLTFEPNSNRLYLYSPILDGLPKDEKIRLNLYEALLEGSMLGGQMAGGGCGVAVKEELILMHCVLEMGIGTDSSALRRFAPLFVEAVEKWRDRVQKILEGRDEGPSLTAPTTKPPSAQGGTPGAPGGAAPGGAPGGQGPAGGQRPGDFMKI